VLDSPVLEALTARLEDNFVLLGGAMFLGLAVLETTRPARPATGPLIWRWTANIGFYLANVLLFSLVITQDHVLAVLGVNGPAMDGPVAALGRVAGEWPVLICGFLASEFFLYVAHRAEHGVATLWRMHVVHHSDSELDASTGFRHYPVEGALHVLIGTAIFVALGVPAWVGVVCGMISYVIGVTQHANVHVFAFGVDRALQWVLVTPDMHRVHHSVRRADHDSNYGNILSIWDHLFGTYRAVSEEEHAAMAFGIAGLRDAAEARPDRVFLLPFWMPREAQRAPPDRFARRRQGRQAGND
jgi:sterol desaturase/sphingolipid hydroxylase (fatty acid hydroxylase superfamily)